MNSLGPELEVIITRTAMLHSYLYSMTCPCNAYSKCAKKWLRLDLKTSASPLSGVSVSSELNLEVFVCKMILNLNHFVYMFSPKYLPEMDLNTLRLKIALQIGAKHRRVNNGGEPSTS